MTDSLPPAGAFVAPSSGSFSAPASGSFVAPAAEPEKPPRDPRAEKWRLAWVRLYARTLPRAEHEVERDKMFAWAAERGQTTDCLAGLSASRSFYEKHEPFDIPFGKAS